MSDRRYGRDDLRKPESGDREISLTELVDGVVRKVVTAIVLAGGLVALGAYAGGGRTDVEAPRFQVSAAPDGRFYRIDTETGKVIGCQGDRCTIVLQHGQGLEDEVPGVSIQIDTNPRPALPPPAQNGAAPAPSPAANPAPAPAPATR